MNAIQPSSEKTYDFWVDAVCEQIEAQGLTRSDAQGCIQAKPFIMAQAWGEGLDAQATASRVIGQN